MKRILQFLTCSFLLFTSCSKIRPTQLTCEYLKDFPLVDIQHPRLAWINVASENERGQLQTAYQIKVATTKEKLSEPDLWDSKKVKSDQSIRVKYRGKELKSRQECWWQVRVWDKNRRVSEWSKPAVWRMGLLNPSDWKAKWIGAPWQDEKPLPKNITPNAFPEKMPPPAPMFRKEFNIKKKVEKAVVFVTGLGYFELYLNGEKVGDDVLVPNQTNYGKRPEIAKSYISVDDNFHEYKVMYLAYDITNQLHDGHNAIGSILGNGFYNPAKFWTAGYGTPRFLAQVHITYADGNEDVIVSDQSWKASKSPILMDMVYYGEHYDARFEQTGWCSPGFDDSNWEAASKKKAPEGKLVAHTAPTDKVTQTIDPISVEKTGDGTYLVDFGVEISGWLSLKDATGPSGHKVEIKYISNTYSGDNSYVFKGGAPESYAARFNWFVFSKVEISNWPGELKPEQLLAEAVNTLVEESANFHSSNQLFNDINKIWKRSQLDNMHGGIASDCPHRERSAYTGDGQVACVTVMHNFNAQSFYKKWISDIRGAQNIETGYVPNGAPWQPGCGGGVAWGAAICIMPWEFYVHYGDLDMLKNNYDAMKAYIRYMKEWITYDGIMHHLRVGNDGKPLKWFNLGEWCTPGENIPNEIVHTFYFWKCAAITSETAKILGKIDDAKDFKKLADETKEAFHQKFYDAEKGTYGNNGGNIFAFKMGVPDDRYKNVIASLKANLKRNNGHLDTGIFGTQFFFEVLTDNGMHDLAYAAMNKRTEPSFGNWIEKGSTTTRERWDEGGSHNHPMFGGGLVWFYRKLAGMNADPKEPGYRHIIFKPHPVEELDFVSYSNETPYGEAGISWKNEIDNFQMGITVPVGSYATVHIPAKNINQVSENGTPLNKAKGVQFVTAEKDEIIVNIESGKYYFQIN